MQKNSIEKIRKSIESENYKLLDSNYINQKSKLRIKHLECGNIFEMSFDAWEHRKRRCPYCTSQNYTNAEFLEKLNKITNNKYTVLTEYKNKRTKVKVKCNDCGYIFESLPGNLYKSQCANCAKINSSNKQKKKIEEIEIPEEYIITGEYLNNKTPVKIKHLKCGKEFEATTTNLRGGTRCPYCYSSSSKGEKELFDFVSSLINCEKYKFYIDKQKHRFYEIDVFVPEKNIGFEFDGLYWHSKKDKNYHINKTLFLEKHNIRLVHIFEDEWNNKKDIIKDKIKSILGFQKNKIYARKCNIKEISSKERNIFLEENHIQGSDKANISLGLFNNEKLVAVMSFCKLRKSLGQKNSEDGVYELSRFSGLLNYTIIGGFSKLLKYAEENYHIKKILTYADARFSWDRSNVYIKNGFSFSHLSKPSYFYTKDFSHREFRYTFRKSELKNKFPALCTEEKTEEEIMKEAGYSKIYNCGNLVFIKEICK